MTFLGSSKDFEQKIREELTALEFSEFTRLGPFGHPYEAIAVMKKIISNRKVEISPEEWVGAA